MEYYCALFALSAMVDAVDMRNELFPYPITRLETALRLYYVRHSFEHSGTFLIYPLSLLANLTLEALRRQTAPEAATAADPELTRTLRSTLFLCLKGLHDQGQHIYLAAVVYRVALKRLSEDELDRLQTGTGLLLVDESEANTSNGGQGSAALATRRYCRSLWPVPDVKMDGAHRVERLDSMVEQYVDKEIQGDDETEADEDDEDDDDDGAAVNGDNNSGEVGHDNNNNNNNNNNNSSSSNNDDATGSEGRDFDSRGSTTSSELGARRLNLVRMEKTSLNYIMDR